MDCTVNTKTNVAKKGSMNHETNKKETVELPSTLSELARLASKQVEEQREIMASLPSRRFDGATKIENSMDMISIYAVDVRISHLREGTLTTGLDLVELSEELESLVDLQGKVRDYQGIGGGTLIRDSYMEDNCMVEAADMHGVDIDAWPFDCINWERAVDAIRCDYYFVDFDGVDYWIRN